MLLLSLGLYRLRYKTHLILKVRRVYYQLIKAMNLIKSDIQRELLRRKRKIEEKEEEEDEKSPAVVHSLLILKLIHRKRQCKQA